MALPDAYIRCSLPIDGARKRWFVWILSAHSEPEGDRRTYLGDLVTRAKYHGDGVAMAELRVSLRHSVQQIAAFDARVQDLAACDMVIAVPFPPGKREEALSVPHVIADEASNILGAVNLSSSVSRVPQSGEAKSGSVVLPSSFQVKESFGGRRVLIVDDLFRTGGTIGALASALRSAGAISVVGLCVTRAYKGYVSR